MNWLCRIGLHFGRRRVMTSPCLVLSYRSCRRCKRVFDVERIRG